ncbi:MAG TPA: hypothetical protein PKW95_23615 [bacterium]|nr:hypothetical protein [bacterium]
MFNRKSVSAVVLGYLLKRNGQLPNTLNWIDVVGELGLRPDKKGEARGVLTDLLVDWVAVGLAIDRALTVEEREIYFIYLLNGRRIHYVRQLLHCGRTKAYDWVEKIEQYLMRELNAEYIRCRQS